MEIKYENNAKYLLVAISGRLDTFSAPDFEKNNFDTICQAAKPVIVNCSGLEYISSAGLRVILALAKKLGRDKFCICGVSGLVEDVIAMSGFESIISIYPGFEEAITACAL